MNAHTAAPWYVLADPVWKDKHPLHNARFIVTSTEVELFEEDGTQWRFTDPKASIICTLTDAPEQAYNARLIAAAPALLVAAKAALPFLADHVAFTRDEGPADRIAFDNLAAAIGSATSL